MPLTEQQKEEVRKKADRAQAKAKKLDNGVRYAIASVLPNVLNGCFWGFTTTADLKEHKKAIQDEDRMIARKLSDGAVLLEVDPHLLIESVQQIDKNAFTVADAKNIKEAQDVAKFEFEKFLITKGKKPEGYTSYIGIYCINKVTCITLGKIQYRAFRLNMNQTLQMLSRYNYQIEVGGEFIEPEDAIEREEELWNGTKLSPSQTGVFIRIRYNSTPDEMRVLEKKFKAKYSLD